jgi:hypothetical protein
METRGMFTCRDGWHVVARAGELTYVRVAVRLRDEHGTYGYRVGEAPDDAVCGTIWCYGDESKPWTCLMSTQLDLALQERPFWRGGRRWAGCRRAGPPRRARRP